MSKYDSKALENWVSKAKIKEIDQAIKKYPAEQRQSAVMDALRILQEEQGHLTPASMDAIALYLDMPSIAVYEVATFYSMYEHAPTGRNRIFVCKSISCHLRGAPGLIKDLEQRLGAQCGETTEDGRFTLTTAECLGACIYGPMMQVNKDYHESVTTEHLDKILEQYS